MAVETIRELGGWKGSAVLVKAGEDHYVVSSVTPIIGGPETLVFAADEQGEVTDWGEVAGGRGLSRSEAIADLEDSLASRDSQAPKEGTDG